MIHLVTSGKKIQVTELSVLEYPSAYYFQFDGTGGCMIEIETNPHTKARLYEPIVNFNFNGVQATGYEHMLDLINDMFVPKGDGGGGEPAKRFGIEDNTGIQNRNVDMQNFDFVVTNANNSTLESGNETFGSWFKSKWDGEGNLFTTEMTCLKKDYGTVTQISMGPYALAFWLKSDGSVAGGEAYDYALSMPNKQPRGLPLYMPVTINGLTAGPDGNIDVPLGGGGGGVDKLGWFYPEDYGAKGDGVTDDAAAFNAMIAAMPARGGRVQLRSVMYIINSTVTINKSIMMIGNYYSGTAFTLVNSGSIIRTTADNIVVFDVKEDYCYFSNFGMSCYQTGASTSGAALRFSGNTRSGWLIYNYTLATIEFEWFYEAISSTNAAGFIIRDCKFKGCLHWTIDVGCTDLPDFGDSIITGCDFVGASGALAAIHQSTSGGLKISNNKFNWSGGDTKFLRHIHCEITTTTVDLIITGNSFENYAVNAIDFRQVTGTFENIIITGNQFSGYGASGRDIVVAHHNAPGVALQNLSIVANTFKHEISNVAIEVTNAHNVTLINTYSDGYLTPVLLTDVTNVTKIDTKELYLTGNQSDSSLKIGTLEFQNYGLGNSWIGDNVYYNGDFKARASGTTTMFYFQGDEGQFRVGSFQSAGLPFTLKIPFKIGAGGTVGLGGDIATINANFTGSTLLATSSGVAIGTNGAAPNVSAILDLSSTTRALLLPRMTKAQRDAMPVKTAGNAIFQTDNTAGLRVYNGTNWVRYTETID